MNPQWKIRAFRLAHRLAGIVAAALAVSGCPNPPTPSAGNYFNAGGYYLYVEDSGLPGTKDAERLPPLVLVNGVGLTESSWDKVQPELAKMVRVISYDRGGVGQSERGHDPRTGQVIAEELDTLLSGMGVTPPYVLAAHSLGGFFVRLYANVHPDKVAALLLIDTAHEDMNNRFAEMLSPESCMNYQLTQGFVLLYAARDPGSLGEYLNFENTANQIRRNRELPNVPLIYLGHDSSQFPFVNQDEVDLAYELTVELAEEQVALVPHGEYREIAGSSHMIQGDKPEAVIQAVQDLYARLGFDISRSPKASGG